MSIMLYHYFDSKIGPFRNLSDLPDEEADRVILQFRQQKNGVIPSEQIIKPVPLLHAQRIDNAQM